jgi:hypothetical protein
MEIHQKLLHESGEIHKISFNPSCKLAVQLTELRNVKFTPSNNHETEALYVYVCVCI